MYIRAEKLATRYRDVASLIGWVIYGFIKRYGGDYDTLLSEANFIYLRARNRYDPEKGAFKSYLWYQIWYGLIDLARKGGRSNGRMFTNTFDSNPDIFEYTMKENPIKEIKRKLTGDARLVVNLVFSSPPEIASVIERRGARPLNYRFYIRKYLLSKGWPPLRIAETFEEIRAVL